jgi:hypothetical protein
MIAGDFQLGQVFLSMLYFFLFFVWIWLLISVFGDIFRSADLSGWGKAGWTILVLVLPYFGVFIYLIARGGKMHEHAIEAAQAQDSAARAYIREAAASPAEELAKLADLKASGVIDEAEFQKLKAKALA